MSENSEHNSVVDLRLLEISLLERTAQLALRYANSRFPGSCDEFAARVEAGQHVGAWAQAIEDYMEQLNKEQWRSYRPVTR